MRAVVRTGTAGRLSSAAFASVVETDDLFAEPPSWWERNCKRVTHVAHFAWIATPGTYLTAPANLDCLIGTLNLAKGAAAAKVNRFLGIGTCFEYDVDHRVLASDTPLRPTTPYAGTKAAAFEALSQWLPAAGVSFAWARLFYLYGSEEHPDRLVPYLHRKLAAGEPADLTSGQQIRDFLDVRTGALTLLDTLLGQVDGAFNVCSGEPITVRQFAESIASQYGRSDLLKFGTRPENLTDPQCVVGIPGQQSSERRK